MSFLADWLLLWWFRRRHPGWSILKLPFGYRAYRGFRDLQADTMRSLERHIRACDAADKAAAS